MENRDYLAMSEDPLDGLSRAELLEILDEFEAARKKFPSAVTYNNCGVVLVKLERYEEGLEQYAKALELNPKYDRAHFNVGKAYQKMGNNEKAIEYYKSAVELNPKNVSAWNNIGVGLRALGRARESLEYYDQAIRVKPYYVWAWANKAFALMTLGELSKAAECCDAALRINPSFKPAMVCKSELVRKGYGHLFEKEEKGEKKGLRAIFS